MLLRLTYFFIIQLEKAREATDAANLRAAYAEAATDLIENGKDANYDETITATQTDTSTWSIFEGGKAKIGGIEVDAADSWEVKVDTTNNTVTIS